MFKTRITEMFGIKYPIIQGGLQWLATSQLASAVSNAGGLGIINALSFATDEEFRQEIRKMRDLTDKPFGANVSMLPMLGDEDLYNSYFEVVIEEGVKIVETSGRNPGFIVPELKKAGVKILHKVPAVRFAKKAESVGVDAVTIVGFECGGHPGMDDVTSLVLIPKAAQALKIPVVGAGGFADGRGLVAALALGAEAVLMGTRFMATRECPVHDNFKHWMVTAKETDTTMILRSIKNAERVRRNKSAEAVFELEGKGSTLEELLPIISGKVGRDAYLSGDLEKGVIACGQAVGLVSDIPTVKELIDRIIDEAKDICGKFGKVE